MTSEQLFAQAQTRIPGGVNSPVRSFKHVGTAPIYFQRAEGPYLYDVDGRRFTDFCLGFGPHLLGHSHPRVVKAIQAQASLGTAFGACHPREVFLADKILSAYPFLNKLRLVNSGTEAVMTALRVARGFTGRNKILKFEGCYHGHSDGLLVKAGSGVAHLAEASSLGVPPSLVADTVVARYDDLGSIREAFEKNPGQIAALIVEPIPANHGLWIPSYEHIKAVFELARSKGALVIFDEVITGFRVGLGGACAFYDLTPDIVTLGKIIGGGLPLAAVAGRAEVMDVLAPVGGVYQAGTLSGNVLAVTAGLETLEELFSLRPQLLKFDNRCELFANELQQVASQLAEVQMTALGSIFWLRFGKPSTGFPLDLDEASRKQFATFFRGCLDVGVYLPPSPYEVGFVSLAHSDSVLEETLSKVKKCLVR